MKTIELVTREPRQRNANRFRCQYLAADDADARRLLSEPGDGCEAFAGGYRGDFVKGVSLESDKHAGVAVKSEAVRARFVVKAQRASGERIIQKHDDGDPPDPQMIEIELRGIAVLMTNKKVAWFITQKLRPLAIGETVSEVFFQ